MNLHSKVLFKLIKTGVKKFEPTPTAKIPKPSGCKHKEIRTSDLRAYIPNLIIPKEDEDTASRPYILRKVIQWNNRFTAMSDPNEQWKSGDEGEKVLNKMFGAYLPKSRVDWKGNDPTGDKVLEWWAFSNLGAIELKKIPERDLERGKDEEEQAVYISGYEFMTEFEVRKNLSLYGGDCYFNKKGKILKIRLHGKDVYPTDGSDWEFAKFTYRSSSFIWATIYHHLYLSHYNISNIATLATYRNLKPSHPLRQFLKPFTFRTAAINFASNDTLLPKKSIIHRASGFTWGGLMAAFNQMEKRYAFASFPDDIKAQGLHNETGNLFAYRDDGMAFWKHVNDFVGDAVENSSLFKKPIQDDNVKRWWEETSQYSKGNMGTLNHSNLTGYLTDFFFTVSGFHSFVGHVSPFVANPKIAAGKMFPGQAISDRQTSEQVSIVASITGLPMPLLSENFTHLMPDTDLSHRVKNFNNGLKDLNTEIKARNKKRAIPCHAFAPELMGTSVAI